MGVSINLFSKSPQALIKKQSVAFDSQQDVAEYISSANDIPYCKYELDIPVGLTKGDFLFVDDPAQNRGILLYSAENEGGYSRAKLANYMDQIRPYASDVITHEFWCTQELVGSIYAQSLSLISLKGGLEDATAIEKEAFSIFEDAASLGASDIHIYTYDATRRAEVQFRVDGHLRAPRNRIYDAVLAAIRTMYNGWNAAGGRSKNWSPAAPLDARIMCEYEGKNYSFRFTQSPTTEGIQVVLRELSSEVVTPPKDGVSWSNYGISAAQADILEGMLGRDKGLIIVGGTTGSGKTFTLMNCMSHLRVEFPGKSIQTAEDPVEYRVQGVVHKDVNEVDVTGMKMTPFQALARSVLRADPDIILVGEIRDDEIAHTAADAIDSGHLVLSTTHTTSSRNNYTRIAGFGLPDTILKDSKFFAGLLYQKLIGTVCPDCHYTLRQAIDKDLISHEDVNLLSDCVQHHSPWLSFEWLQDRIPVANPKGCPTCSHYGVKGRTACLEIFDPQSHPEVFDALAMKEMDKAKLMSMSRGMVQLGKLNELSNYDDSCILDIPDNLEWIDHAIIHMLNGKVAADKLIQEYRQALVDSIRLRRQAVKFAVKDDSEESDERRAYLQSFFDLSSGKLLSNKGQDSETIWQEVMVADLNAFLEQEVA